MKESEFTPEFVQETLLDYTVNENFPDDELGEIGSKVQITGLSDVEIEPVRKTQSGNFIIDGAATLETETDMGEGDTSDKGYPMKFSYEFDDDGKIVKQHRRHIDTSSFFR